MMLFEREIRAIAMRTKTLLFTNDGGHQLGSRYGRPALHYPPLVCGDEARRRNERSRVDEDCIAPIPVGHVPCRYDLTNHHAPNFSSFPPHIATESASSKEPKSQIKSGAYTPLVAPLPPYAAASAAGEVLGVGFLVLTVLAVSTKFVPKSGSGIAIGAALLAGLLTTRGVLNPAIALAMGLGGTPALWAPLAGALVFGPLALLYLPSGDTKPASSANKKPTDTRGSGVARPWRPTTKPRSPDSPRTGSPRTFTARHK